MTERQAIAKIRSIVGDSLRLFRKIHEINGKIESLATSGADRNKYRAVSVPYTLAYCSLSEIDDILQNVGSTPAIRPKL